MARSKAIWGIDIGQSALKALRCHAGDEPDQIVADAFDFIEYPKILSQPEANAEELVRDALAQFLSRNSVRGDRVAISVSGQSGLARFIKLPPVESKKIPDIVKYEARQQIPFALEDVVWDYQQMAGGSEEDGFALETEVGLFAMKRDQVNRALAPFLNAGVEIDIVQLAPLALYNYVAFDQMQDLPPPDQFDPENPPPSIVLLSLGTDTTDLVVTNGYRVWQRSIPLGGNHFTKVLTKELKLTFAKAEHLKRNASQAPDPKAVFSAMKQVFSDLLTEVQRSIGYFSGIDRRAKIGRVIVLGNAMKLPGLQRYLGQNLGHDVVKLDAFRGLVGPGVVDAPAFKENILSFATCYGLALQGLADTKIHTNLLPAEMLQDRMIRSKKPWAVAAAAVLLLGCTVNAFGHWSSWRTARTTAFDDAMGPAKAVVSESQRLQAEYGSEKDRFGQMQAIGNNLTEGVEGRLAWLKVMKAINLAIPRDPDALEKPPEEREELHIDSIQCIKARSLDAWYNGRNAPTSPDGMGMPAEESMEEETSDEAETEGAEAAEQRQPPSGEGWIFRITGYHYHNKQGDTDHEGGNYVRETLMRNLEQKRLPLPPDEKLPAELQTKPDQTDFPVGDLGIGFPFLIDPPRIVPSTFAEREGTPPNEPNPVEVPVRVFDFVVEFCWQPQLADGQEDGDESGEDVASN